MKLEEAVGKVLEGWTLPNSVRKILEEAYFSEPQRDSSATPRTWVNATTWRGLTDDDDIDWDGTGNLKQLVEAVEAKLKEKNNGS